MKILTWLLSWVAHQMLDSVELARKRGSPQLGWGTQWMIRSSVPLLGAGYAKSLPSSLEVQQQVRPVRQTHYLGDETYHPPKLSLEVGQLFHVAAKTQSMEHFD